MWTLLHFKQFVCRNVNEVDTLSKCISPMELQLMNSIIFMINCLEWNCILPCLNSDNNLPEVFSQFFLCKHKVLSFVWLFSLDHTHYGKQTPCMLQTPFVLLLISRNPKTTWDTGIGKTAKPCSLTVGSPTSTGDFLDFLNPSTLWLPNSSAREALAKAQQRLATCKGLAWFIVAKHSPYHPCMVYLPTFTTKNNQM